MLSARPGPLNPGATSPLSRHHLTRPSRAAGSFFGPSAPVPDIQATARVAPKRTFRLQAFTVEIGWSITLEKPRR